MKLFAKISAIVIAMAMFGMSAMAAGVITLDEEVKIASDATQVIFEVKIDEGSTIGAFSSFALEYDPSLFTYNNDQTTTGYGKIDMESTNETEVWWNTDTLVETTAEEDTLVSYVFDIKDDVDVDNATFTITIWDTYMFANDDMTVDIDVPANTSIKVVVEESDPKPGDIKTEETVLSGSKKYLEIYDQNTQPRYVVIDTLLSKTVNAESVLKATYGDEEKTAKLFDLLTVEGGATGGITIDTLTIKMVLPVNSPKPGTDDFSFDVVNK